MPPPAGAWGVVVLAFHGLKGLLEKALYVSPLGYAVMFCSLPTQGVALGCPMKPLRGNEREAAPRFLNRPFSRWQYLSGRALIRKMRARGYSSGFFCSALVGWSLPDSADVG